MQLDFELSELDVMDMGMTVPNDEPVDPDVSLFYEDDTLYSDPSKGYWTDNLSDTKRGMCLGRILSVNKQMGTMQVIGVDCDINIEIPLTHCQTSKKFGGDVSIPAKNSQVILAEINGDYYPITYIRPFSTEFNWSYGIPDEMDSGDIGWATEGGGKLLLFENGFLHMESSPNCLRQMYPLEDGEGMQDTCREYGLFSDAGSIKAEERNKLNPLGASHIIFEGNKRFGTNKYSVGVLELGSLDEVSVKSGVELRVNMGTSKTPIPGPSLRMTDDDMIVMKSKVSASIETAKLSIGSSTATEPVVLGKKLLTEITRLSSKLNAFIATYNLHTHLAAGTATAIPVGVQTPYTPKNDWLSTLAFVSR